MNWKIIKTSEIGEYAIVEQDGTTVCNPSPMGGRNAALLAAAPDLLEALKAIIGHDAHLLPNKWRVEAARAALAKARGQA